MTIVYCRVDDRLIHGQIVQAWLPKFSINEVVVVSDSVANDSFRKDMMRLSLPSEFSLKVFNSKQAIDYIKTTNQQLFIIAETSKEITDIVDAGIDITEVNIGGMHYTNGKEKIAKTVFVDAQDKERIKRMADKNVKLRTNEVPQQSSLKTEEVIRLCTR